MNRRQFLGAASAIGIGAALPGCATTGRAESEDARLRALLDRIFYARLEQAPEHATSLGLDKGE